MQLFLQLPPKILASTDLEIKLRLGVRLMTLWSSFNEAAILDYAAATGPWLSIAADFMWELFLQLAGTFLIVSEDELSAIVAETMASSSGSAADTSDRGELAGRRGKGSTADAAVSPGKTATIPAAAAAIAKHNPALKAMITAFNDWISSPGFTMAMATSLKQLWQFWVPNMCRKDNYEVQGWLAQNPVRLAALYRFISSTEMADWVWQGVSATTLGGPSQGSLVSLLSCWSTSSSSSSSSISAAAVTAAAATTTLAAVSTPAAATASSSSSAAAAADGTSCTGGPDSSSSCSSIRSEILCALVWARAVGTMRSEVSDVLISLFSMGDMFQEILMCCLRWTWGINQIAEAQQQQQQRQEKEEDQTGGWQLEEQQQQQQQQQQGTPGTQRLWIHDPENTTGLAPFLLPPLGSALLCCGADPTLELEGPECDLGDRPRALPMAVMRAVKGFWKVAQEVIASTNTTTSSSSSSGSVLYEGGKGASSSNSKGDDTSEGGNTGSSSSSSTAESVLVTKERLAMLVQLLQSLPAVRSNLKPGVYAEQVSCKLLLLCISLRVASLEVREEFFASSDGKELLRVLLVLLLEERPGQELKGASSSSDDSSRMSRVEAEWQRQQQQQRQRTRQHQQQQQRTRQRAESSSSTGEEPMYGDNEPGGSGDNEGIVKKGGCRWVGIYSDLGASQGNLDPSPYMNAFDMLSLSGVVPGLPALITQVLSCLLLEPVTLFSKNGGQATTSATTATAAAAGRAGAEASAESSAPGGVRVGVVGGRGGVERKGEDASVLMMKGNSTSSSSSSSHISSKISSSSRSSKSAGSKLGVLKQHGHKKRMKGSAVSPEEKEAAVGSSFDEECDPSRRQTLLSYSMGE
jgi:hypothetical protein